jgi:hypothetical protein
MSSNDEMFIVERNGKFEIHWNGCVDNDYDINTAKPWKVCDTREEVEKELKDLSDEGIEPEYGISWIGLAKPCCRLAVQKTIAQIEKTIDERIKELKESIAMAIELDSMLNDSTTDVLVYEQQIKVLESIKSEISKEATTK